MRYLASIEVAPIAAAQLNCAIIVMLLTPTKTIKFII